eukprot:7375661-Prymnesium_polylepis.1
MTRVVKLMRIVAMGLGSGHAAVKRPRGQAGRRGALPRCTVDRARLRGAAEPEPRCHVSRPAAAHRPSGSSPSRGTLEVVPVYDVYILNLAAVMYACTALKPCTA